ncbi:hypothetical protein [Rathayibacter sp. AY1C1]|uniref:hypothetical protein n=1 Tax=Rathayibacter sp. AY1C1 TaxID=2080534 RepID=UPI0011B024D3|nr:hypothetical protein [Rathayibacter sp. AY1C1]
MSTVESLKSRQLRRSAEAVKALTRLSIGRGFQPPGRPMQELPPLYDLRTWEEFVVALQWATIEVRNAGDMAAMNNALWPREIEKDDGLAKLTERRENFCRLHNLSLSTLLRSEQRGFEALDNRIRIVHNSRTWRNRLERGILSAFEMNVEAAAYDVVQSARIRQVNIERAAFFEAVKTSIDRYQLPSFSEQEDERLVS